MPRSQSAFKHSNSVIGKSYKVKVIKIDKDEQSVVVSRKKLLDEDRKVKKEAISKIVENDGVIEGVVKKITTYGMFVDVGGDGDGIVFVDRHLEGCTQTQVRRNELRAVGTGEVHLRTNVADIETKTELTLTFADVDVVLVVARNIGSKGTGSFLLLRRAVGHVGEHISDDSTEREFLGQHHGVAGIDTHLVRLDGHVVVVAGAA